MPLLPTPPTNRRGPLKADPATTSEMASFLPVIAQPKVAEPPEKPGSSFQRGRSTARVPLPPTVPIAPTNPKPPTGRSVSRVSPRTSSLAVIGRAPAVEPPAPAPVDGRSEHLTKHGTTEDVRTRLYRMAAEQRCMIFIRETVAESAISFARGLGIGKPLSVKGKSSQGSFTRGAIVYFARLSKAVTKESWAPSKFRLNQEALLHQVEEEEAFDFIPKYLTSAAVDTLLDKLVAEGKLKAKPADWKSGKAICVDEVRNKQTTQIWYILKPATLDQLKVNGCEVFNLTRVQGALQNPVYQVHVRFEDVYLDTPGNEDSKFWIEYWNKHRLPEEPELTTVADLKKKVCGTGDLAGYVPVTVLAERVDGAYYETVADYDMFAICPQMSLIREKLMAPFDFNAPTKLGDLTPKLLNDFSPRYVRGKGVLSIYEENMIQHVNDALNGKTGSAPAGRKSVREEQGGGDVLAARHGCETGNPFYTVPFDFDWLILIKPQCAIAQHELSLAHRKDYFNFSLPAGEKFYIARDFLFPMSPVWGVHVMPPDDPKKDFVDNAARPGWPQHLSATSVPATGSAWLQALLNQHFQVVKILHRRAGGPALSPTAPAVRLPDAAAHMHHPGREMAEAMINLAAKLLYYKAGYSALGKELETYLDDYNEEHSDHPMGDNMKVFYNRRGEILGDLCDFLNKLMTRLSTLITSVQAVPKDNPILELDLQGAPRDDSEHRNAQLTYLLALMDKEIQAPNPYPPPPPGLPPVTGRAKPPTTQSSS